MSDFHVSFAFRASEPGTVVVKRPEPGLARGAFEAPAWVFVVVALMAVAGAVFVFGRRMKRRNKK